MAAISDDIKMKNEAAMNKNMLRYEKVKRANDLDKLQKFLSDFRVENERMRANNCEIFIDINNASEFFDSFTRQNFENIQDFINHPISGFYLFFEKRNEPPIGIVIIWEVDERGYAQISLGFFQEKTGKGYGTQALNILSQVLGSKIGRLVVDADGNRVFFKGFYVDIDIRNVPSLIMAIKLKFKFDNYFHRIINAKPEHHVSFSFPISKPDKDYLPTEYDCVMAAQIKEKQIKLLHDVTQRLVDKEKRNVALQSFQDLTSPLYELHKRKIDMFKEQIRLGIGNKLNNNTLVYYGALKDSNQLNATALSAMQRCAGIGVSLGGEAQIGAGIKAPAEIGAMGWLHKANGLITHIEEYFIDPSLNCDSPVKKSKKKKR